MAVEPDPQVTALGREVERALRRVRDLELLVREIAADVEALATAGEPEDGPAGERAWLLVADPEQARAVLADLGEWLAAVYLHYPDAALPSCWLWHPGVVEELWSLRQAHREAYSPRDGSPTKAADWHDRQRPGVARRLHAALRDCELALHEQPRPAPVVPLLGSAARIASAWITSRTTPHPAPDELTSATHHDHAQHRSRHHS